MEDEIPYTWEGNHERTQETSSCNAEESQWHWNSGNATLYLQTASENDTKTLKNP